jgi:4-hydroxyphenylpyruvate dioxygenase
MSSTLLHPEVHASKDFLPITGTDYIEFYVGNARQSAYFYRAAFGMSLVAWAGPKTGLHDRSSYVLQQGDIRFILTTPLRPDGGIADHIRRHGDGVRDVAMTVDDAKLAWRETTRRGARSVHECHELRDEYGRVRLASIAAYGDTIHTFVERGGYYGPFLPGYEPIDLDPVSQSVGLTEIDHIASNVGWNEMRRWVDYYNDILGFSLYRHSEERKPSTEYSAFVSKVVASGDGSVKLPINEPAQGGGKSRIEQYLEFYHGPGVQHIALATSNILETVAKMRHQGVEFLSVPRSYYQRLAARVDRIEEPVEDLEQLGILADADEDGYLLQAFTRPVEDRPTLFFEILQRKGSRSFGNGNDNALAEAIEEERALRERWTPQ